MKKTIVFTVLITLIIGGTVVFADSTGRIVEKLTGKSVDELRTLGKEGKTLFEIAEDEGVLDELKETLSADHRERLNALVDEGKMTQDEAEEMLEKHQEMLNEGELGKIRFREHRGSGKQMRLFK